MKDVRAKGLTLAWFEDLDCAGLSGWGIRYDSDGGTGRVEPEQQGWIHRYYKI